MGGMMVRTFRCTECGIPHQLIVHADSAADPGIIDRQRLLAASQQWVLDLDGRAWCPKHRTLAAQR